MKVAAVILAGGKGERLGGVNKALIELGGRRLIDRAVDCTTSCDPVLIAVGRQSFDVPAGTTPVLDLAADYAGPLAGVAAAAAYLGNSVDALFSLAVDTPAFPRDFLARALPLIDTAPAVVGAYGTQDYPTNALWNVRILTALVQDMTRGTAPHSLKRLAQRVGATRLDYAQFAPADPFRNVNTPEDLAFFRDAESPRKPD